MEVPVEVKAGHFVCGGMEVLTRRCESLDRRKDRIHGVSTKREINVKMNKIEKEISKVN